MSVAQIVIGSCKDCPSLKNEVIQGIGGEVYFCRLEGRRLWPSDKDISIPHWCPQTLKPPPPPENEDCLGWKHWWNPFS